MFYLIPLLSTIALAGPVCPAEKRHLAEKKCKLIFKKENI